MGAVAERGADVVIVTSDNPRTEDPDAIIDEIEAGMSGSRHLRITDRRRRSRTRWPWPADDIVLLAGKGHETYQILGTEKHRSTSARSSASCSPREVDAVSAWTEAMVTAALGIAARDRRRRMPASTPPSAPTRAS
jgi:hypothetical protein